MSLGYQTLYVLYLLFLFAMIIVGLVFLTDNISDNKAVIPNFNNTMYEFLYVGLWIIVGVTAIQFLLAFFSLGYLLNQSFSIRYIEADSDPKSRKASMRYGSRKSSRKLAHAYRKR